MKLLLDSHALLWYAAGDARLSVAARSAIDDIANDSFVSLASLWELAIKAGLRKLELRPDFLGFVKRAVMDNGFEVLQIDQRHLERVVWLPQHHRDPFDRMLVAQAALEGMTLVSADEMLDAYGAARLW